MINSHWGFCFKRCSMNNLEMLEIWDALLNLEEASGNLFQTEIQSIKNKLEELECLTN